MQGWSGNTFKYESYWQQKPEEIQCFIYQFLKNEQNLLQYFELQPQK